MRNGAIWSWNTRDGNTQVEWTDGNVARAWSIDRTDKPFVSKLWRVAAVDGPYVFLRGEYETDNGKMLVLDTRTGAYIDTGLKSVDVQASGKRVAIYYRAHGRYQTATIDVSKLPGLHR